MEYKNRIEYKVYGKYALFTDPLTKTGMENFSYMVPTYQALKGITESIYWKPTFQWIIDDVRIMKKFQTESKGVRLLFYNRTGKKSSTIAMHTYLRDVEYRVRAHMEWNENRKDLARDRDEHKHYTIARRMIKCGGRRDIFLGTRECQAYVEPCFFEKEVGDYDDITLPLGTMVHGITYADEAVREEEKGNMTVRLWNPVMENGVIHFIRPEECTQRKHIRPMKMKQFSEENFSGLQEFERGD